jgi:pimeloyl-ACP methyl ester carboxylesterase
LTGWLSWIPHQERLSGHHQVIRVQPIHNELGSAGIRGDPGYSPEIERESLRMTLDDLGLDSVDFAGWSAGGQSLIDFALSHPPPVRSLTLVEPASDWVLEQARQEDPQSQEATELIRRLAGRDVSEADLARFLHVAGFVSDSSEARLHPNWERWVPHRATLSWLGKGSLQASHSLAELRKIGVPVLLVKGSRSVPWERRVVDLLGELIPMSKVLELEGDHACHIESIEAFIDGLEGHLHSLT